jgi:hypothetical protein
VFLGEGEEGAAARQSEVRDERALPAGRSGEASSGMSAQGGAKFTDAAGWMSASK